MSSECLCVSTTPPEVDQLPPRGCAVCQGTQTRLLFPQRFVPLSEGSLLRGYDVVACTRCGFCYGDRLPDQAAFDQYYRDMSKYEQPSGNGVSEFEVQRFRATVEMIQEWLPERTARITEIGCATGLLLSMLKQAGYSRVTGLDPSPVCSRLAAEWYGIPVQCGAMSDNLIPPGSVDLLILIGVVEHIRDLRTALGQMHTMLAPGGRCFITVPDASEYAAGDDAPFQEFSLEHINFFGPISLANLLAGFGFKRVFTRQARQRVNPRTVTPVIHAAFEKMPSHEALPWTPDTQTVAGLERYVAQSQHDNAAVAAALDQLAISRQPTIIWGAGSHTLRLLATSQLRQANLVGIVDSNPRYQGKQVLGVPILKPDAIRDLPATILISSRVFQQNIQHQIQQQLRLPHPVLTLYPSAQ